MSYRVIKLSSGCRFVLAEEGLLPNLRDEIYYQFDFLGKVVGIELYRGGRLPILERLNMIYQKGEREVFVFNDVDLTKVLLG